MRDFVGEQYNSAGDPESAARRARAARQASEELSVEGIRVLYVRSIFIPADETCMHLYRADSVDAAAARASLRLERVAEVIIDVGTTNDDTPRGEAG